MEATLELVQEDIVALDNLYTQLESANESELRRINDQISEYERDLESRLNEFKAKILEYIDGIPEATAADLADIILDVLTDPELENNPESLINLVVNQVDVSALEDERECIPYQLSAEHQSVFDYWRVRIDPLASVVFSTYISEDLNCDGVTNYQDSLIGAILLGKAPGVETGTTTPTS